tara:strand:+ start:213 stop:338 length:126 start_codon:yes stop_codon:yes gene_type:complete
MLDFIDNFIDLLEYYLIKSIRAWLIVLAVMVVYNFIKTQGA